jgi:hypothetical protein
MLEETVIAIKAELSEAKTRYFYQPRTKTSGSGIQ